jgi:hypothetical protein
MAETLRIQMKRLRLHQELAQKTLERHTYNLTLISAEMQRLKSMLVEKESLIRVLNGETVDPCKVKYM